MPNLNTQQNQILAFVNFQSAKKKKIGELIIKKVSRGHFLNCSKIYTVILKSLSIYILTIHSTIHKPL